MYKHWLNKLLLKIPIENILPSHAPAQVTSPTNPAAATPHPPTPEPQSPVHLSPTDNRAHSFRAHREHALDAALASQNPTGRMHIYHRSLGKSTLSTTL